MTTNSKKSALIQAAGLMICFTPQLAHAFPKGDVFVSVANGQVKEFTPGGVLVRTLDTLQAGVTTGMGFDAAGNLYVTEVSANKVSKFDQNGALLGTFGSGYDGPESIVFDRAGNAYVSSSHGGGISKFDSQGNLLANFAIGRTDWIVLFDDQCRIFYDLGEGIIHTYDMCNNTPSFDFTTAAGVFAIGQTGFFGCSKAVGCAMLAADQTQIDLAAFQTLMQSYDVPGEDSWFALGVDPDNMTFWSAGLATSNVYRFDIQTGAVVSHFNTGTPANTVHGLIVSPKAVNSPPTPPSCALTAVVAGPPKQLKITVQDSDNGLQSIQVTDSTNATTSVPPFTAGEKGALTITATKIDPNQGSHVALHLTDTNGATTDCDPNVPADSEVLDTPNTESAAGCSVGHEHEARGSSGLLGALVGLALFCRRLAGASHSRRQSGGRRT